MAANGNTPIYLNDKQRNAMVEFLRQVQPTLQSAWNIREQLVQADMDYQREKDITPDNQRARAVNRNGNPNTLANLTVPVVMPQVEAAHSYLASVFLTGYPIFGMVSDKAHEDAANQMEAVITENSITAGWARELGLCLHDGLKYNIMGCLTEWQQKQTFVAETDLSWDKTQGKPKQVIWEGNTLRRMDLYNTFFDPRVDPARIHIDGEFAGYTELMSRMRFKKFLAELGDSKLPMTAKQALESGVGSGMNLYYTPRINPDAMLNMPRGAIMDWMRWATGITTSEIKYQNYYEVSTVFARLIPEDFNISIPSKATPQIFKLVVVNNQVLVYCERMTNIHDYLPIIFGQPMEDGLGYQTKSFSKNLTPYQDMASGLWNIKVAAARRAVADRMIYDPSKINPADINSANPSAKIPCRPAAYGQPMGNAVYQFPFNDTNLNGLLAEASSVTDMAREASGINRAQQGQFQKGNKTLEEYQDVMSNANDRLQTMALMMEAQFFTPIKHVVKCNMLQFQAAGQVFNYGTQQNVSVDPVTMRNAIVAFKMTDGLDPNSKVMDTDFMQVFMQSIMSIPALQAQYDTAGLFNYFAKLKGFVDVDDFKLAPQQQAAGQIQNAAQTAMQAHAQAAGEAAGAITANQAAGLPAQNAGAI